MKKIFAIFAVLITAVFASANAYAISGDGTAESPFVITTQDDLMFINDFPADNFVLGCDIKLTGTWEPLCTYAEDFTGVLDGRGYTISDLSLKKLGCSGLFKKNCGTIKNLNVSTPEDGLSMTDVTYYSIGLIAGENTGTIENCHVSGIMTIKPYYSSGHAYNPDVGAIAATNSGTIKMCSSNVDIPATTYTSSYKTYTHYLYSGGIVSRNTSDGIISQCYAKGSLTAYAGGIAYENAGKISNSYFIGKASRGIAYANTNGTTENCYAAASGTDLGITGAGTVTNSFYDRSLTTATGTAYGTPKTTQAMKMKRTFTAANWDFDTIWGINSVTNEGYPHLLWETPETQTEPRYTLTGTAVKNTDGEKITEIPAGSFFAEINAVKNDNSKTADTLIIAVYDENGKFIDVKFLSGIYYRNQQVNFGAMFDNSDGNIAEIKAFVWDSANGMTPLSNISVK